MADLILPDPRMEIPELFEPGPTIPPGDYAINESDPYSRGLLHAIVGHQGDLMSPGAPQYTSQSGREAGKFVGNGDHILFPSAKKITDAGFTLAISYKPFNTTADNIVCGTAQYIDGSNNAGWAFRQNGANCELDAGNNTWSATSFNNVFTTNTRKTYIGTFEGQSSIRRLYIDGESITKNNEVNTVSTLNPGATLGLFGNDGSGYFSTRNECEGEIDFLYVWDWLFSADDVQRITKNPRRLLIPA